MPTLTTKLSLPYPEPDHSVNVARDIRALAEAVEGISAGGLPTGVIALLNSTTVPAGWHLCNGTAHGSAALQALLGSPNAPDLNGRILVGASGGKPLHSTGGSATATIAAANLPAHSHAIAGASSAGGAVPNHTHPLSVSGTSPGSGAVVHTHPPNPARLINTNAQHQFATPAKNTGSGLNTWRNAMSNLLAGGTALNASNATHAHGLGGTSAGLAASAAHAHTLAVAAAGVATVSRPNIPASIALTYIIKT